MNRPAFLIAALLALPACDNTSDDIEVLPRAADEEAPDGEAAPDHGHHGKRHHKGRIVEQLCAAVECTPEQQEQLAALRPGRDHDGDRGAHREGRATQFAALADLVRADSIDPAALAAAEAGMKAKHEEHRADQADAIVSAFSILTAEQRAVAADKIETLVPMMIAKHEGDGRKHDPAKRADKQAEHLCEKISCTADQVTAVSAAFASAMPEPDPAAMTKVSEAAAKALRGGSIDAATAGALLDQFEAARPRRHAELSELLPAVHAALGEEQREALADLIEREGPRALTRGKDGKRGRHGKHGKRGRHGKRTNPGDGRQLAG